jgi:hypothetical protein
MSQSFWNHPIETLKEALSIREQIHSLHEKLNRLSGSNAYVPEPPVTTTSARKKSEATRAKTRPAARGRWATKKDLSGHTGGLASGKSGADVISSASVLKR